MDFTIICPGCGSKLKLFDSQVKQKKGSIRCTRCGQKIKYDLSKPDPVQTGFWAETEVPFKVGAQKRFLSIAKARQKNPKQDFPAPVMAANAETPAPRIPPAFDRSHSQFQAFDMKTGTIVGDADKTGIPEGISSKSQSAPLAPRISPVSRHTEPPTLAQRKANIPITRRKAAPAKSAAQSHFRIPHAPGGKMVSAGAPSLFSRLRSFFTSLFKRK